MKDQGHQLQIQVGDIALRAVEADEFSHNFIRPLNPPDPIGPVLV